MCCFHHGLKPSSGQSSPPLLHFLQKREGGETIRRKEPGVLKDTEDCTKQQNDVSLFVSKRCWLIYTFTGHRPLPPCQDSPLCYWQFTLCLLLVYHRNAAIYEELNGFQLSKAPLRPKSLLSGTLTKNLKDHIFRHWIPCTSLTFFFNIFSHYILFPIFYFIFPCLPRLQLLAHPNLISWFFPLISYMTLGKSKYKIRPLFCIIPRIVNMKWGKLNEARGPRECLVLSWGLINNYYYSK